MENLSFETKTTETLQDSPITDESQDSLRRAPFVEALCQEIIELPFKDSFCFGLYGSWGEGKTSVLNLLKNKLLQNHEIILMEFDPWYLASKEAIFKNFLEGLERKLRPVSTKFKKIFEKYFKKLSISGSYLGTGGQIGWELEKEGLLELKEKINSEISKSKKKVVVLIDDIDRLQPDEILLVFKLVKLIADFKYTVFVLSFDAEAVRSSLQSQDVDVDYIDKIIQKPVSLPKIEQGDIDQLLDSELDSLFEKLNLEKQRIDIELENFPHIYQWHAKKFFTTLRNVKRYINSLSSSLSPIVDEVHLFDFLTLELIKVFCPSVYDDIYENWQFYVSQRTPHEVYSNPLEWRHTQKGEEKEEIIKEHLEQLLSNELQKEVCISLLGALFPNINDAFKTHNRFNTDKNARQERRIYSTSFLKYFTLNIPSRELSDVLVRQTISSWSTTPLDAIIEKIIATLLQFKQQERLAEFLIKLHTFKDEITPKIAPLLIRCICRISLQFFKRDWRNDWIDSEYSRAEHLTWDLLEDKIDKSQVCAVLAEVMRDSDSLDFASGIYIRCTQSNESYGSPAVLDGVRKVLINRFKTDFVHPKKDFFQTSEPIYVLLRLWELCAKEEGIDLKKCICAQYVENLLQKNPQYIGKVLDGFVSRPIGRKRDSKEGLRFNISEAEKYLDLDELYKNVTNNESAYSTSEEKEAVELFRRIYEKSKVTSKDKAT